MSDRRNAVLVTHPLLDRVTDRIGKLTSVFRLWEVQDLASFATSEQGRSVGVLAIVGPVGIPPHVLSSFPMLKAVVCAGAGYDGLDMSVMANHGLAVSNTPDAGSEDVAEHALALTLASVRNIAGGDALVRSGGWTAQYRGARHRSLRSLRAGVVGLGSIGMAVARRLSEGGATVSWWGPRNKPTSPYPRAASLRALADSSDVMLLCLPLTRDSRNMIDMDILRSLGPEGLLVNVSRGPIVDEDALRSALCYGWLGAAALDVFVNEPTPPAVWRDVPNTILSPHAGSFTKATMAQIDDLVVANIASFLRDGVLMTPVAVPA